MPSASQPSPTVSGGSPPATTTPDRVATPLVRLAELEREVARLEALMRPAAPREAAAAIGVMLKAFGAAAGGEDDELARLYVAAAADMPADLLKRLCEDIAFGRVDGLDLDWPPKVPRFAALCRERMADRRGEIVRLTRRLDDVKAVDREPSEEERARVAEGLADLSRDLRAASAEASLAEAAARVAGAAAEGVHENE